MKLFTAIKDLVQDALLNHGDPFKGYSETTTRPHYESSTDDCPPCTPARAELLSQQPTTIIRMSNRV